MTRGESGQTEDQMKWRRGTVGSGIAVLAIVLLDSGCSAVLSPGVPLPSGVVERSAAVMVDGESLTVHLASPRAPLSSSAPLVLYASGDGGWFGSAVAMFHTIAGGGFPTAGFSTKELMHIEHKRAGPLAIGEIVTAYQEIVDGARASLRLPPDTDVVLTGWSRGAALSVLVGSRHEAGSHIAGIVAIGLAAEEHLGIEGATDDDVEVEEETGTTARERSIALYPLLSRMAPRRAVIVQATGDSYLPAARARELFGSDSPTARLIAIDARNHRFNGGESRFAAALVDAVRWVAAHDE